MTTRVLDKIAGRGKKKRAKPTLLYAEDHSRAEIDHDSAHSIEGTEHRKHRIIFAPLSSSFMLTSIIGFLISIWFVMDISEPWGFTLALFFVIMFFSSIISMTKAQPIPEHMDELAVHRQHHLIHHGQTDYSPHFKGIHWYEPLLIIYFAAWIYVFIRSVTGRLFETNETFLGIFLMITVIVAIFFVVDIISSERLKKWQQAAFTFIVIFLGALGMFIYYLYKRLKS